MSVVCKRPPVRVALAGLGRAMFADHYPVYKAHPALFDVVAACDIVKERRDIVARDYPECRMFRQLEDMIYERDIDLVDIATRSADHCAHALMSLRAGRWTLLETPLAVSAEEAQMLRGASARAKNRLIVLQRGLFAPDYLLAKSMMADARLGGIHRIVVRREDFVRRDDWQTVKRLGGGAAYYAMTDLMLQALKLMPVPPVQMWSELKRVASLGDAEDYAHVNLRTRTQLSAEIVFDGGVLPGSRQPSFELHGELGRFTVMPGETSGTLVAVAPGHRFPRRRSSVRTPSLADMHEDIPVVCERVSLPPGTRHGPSAFWKCVYDAVRTAAAIPFSIDDSIEALKFSNLMKKASPFGK